MLIVARAFVFSALFIFIYYVAPLEGDSPLGIATRLVVSLGLVLAVSIWQTYRVLNAKYPVLRAVEALAITVPLFILCFSATYFVIGQADVNNFTEVLTRSDALYFTVTTFSTTGFGDIAPVSQEARLVVTGQMVIDLIVLGIGLKVFTAAVQRGRERKAQEDKTSNT